MLQKVNLLIRQKTTMKACTMDRQMNRRQNMNDLCIVSDVHYIVFVKHEESTNVVTYLF